MRSDWPVVEESGGLSVDGTSRKREYDARINHGPPTGMQGLLNFLNELDRRRIQYDLGHHRDDSVMVKVQVPGAYWEVEFFPDGRSEVEVFRSEGGVQDGERLTTLLEEEDAWESKAPPTPAF